MMREAALVALIQNAALLLSMVVVFDLITSRWSLAAKLPGKLLAGVAIGGLCIGLVLASFPLETGIVFDTRSVMLAVSGLFFGAVPTSVAMVMTAAFRLWQGGAGAWTGTYVIVATGGLGIAWRHIRRGRPQDVSVRELYTFGVVVHLVMLALMLTLPWDSVQQVLVAIGVPVMLVYPVATTLLGLILVKRLQREAAVTALAESESQYRTLVESISQKIFTKDRNSVYLSGNENFAKDLGIAVEDFPGMTDYDFFPSELADKYRADDERIINEGETRNVEEMYTYDGREVWTQTLKTPLRDDKGAVVGILGVFWDITERKQAEEALRAALEQANETRETLLSVIEDQERAERALEAERTLLRTLVDHLPVSVYIKDAQGRRTLSNPSDVLHIGAASEAEVLGKTDLDLFPSDLAERSFADDMAVIRTGQPIFNREGMMSLPDGARGWQLTSKVPVRDSAGEVVGLVGISQDITERRENEERLRRHEQLAAIGQLAAGIAHDFRNLLTTIILYAELAQRKLDLPPVGEQYLRSILGEAHKATDLVQRILDFGRRTELESRPLNMADLVADVIAILARTLPEDIHIASDVEPGQLVIEGDAGRLQQVLTNLALNARDAMPDGGTLRFGLTRVAIAPGSPPPVPEMAEAPVPPAWICLSVADTGTGMSAEAYAHLFEPFFTTKETGRGTGLGLAQVYGIVQLHGGYIDVDNTVGEGVTFRIYLPAAEGATEQPVEAAAVAPAGHGEKILLVEDNTQLRAAGQTILTELGYRVLAVTNGREALALWQEENDSALLITDLVMPEMSGKALMQALRAQRPGLKALAMTGYTQERDDDLLAAGFLGVIHKPFDVINLATLVRWALDKE